MFGFIITRHVNSEKTNKYWNRCVKLLRTFYEPSKYKIIIIDDDSNYNFVKPDFDYLNVEIVQSEYPKRGELLPYFYLIKHKWFENAVILHDSVFIHAKINFNNFINKNIKFVPFWHFYPDKESIENTKRIIYSLNYFEPIKNKIALEQQALGMPSEKWYGIFGAQCFINTNFLLLVEKKYGLSKLVNSIKNRIDRCCFERIIGCILFTENYNNVVSIFGDIMKYQKWGYNYDNYIDDLNKNIIKKSVVKIWTGR